MDHEKKTGSEEAGFNNENIHNNNIPENNVDIKAECAAAAECYLKAGLSIIPIRADGTKRPPISWKCYQSERADLDQAKAWAENGFGIGIVCGGISGNLEVIDFDDPDLFPKWLEVARKEGQDDLLPHLYVVSTPGPGIQLYYRCEESIQGNQVLACRPDPADPKKSVTVIETRGEGGYVIAAGSPPACHPNNIPYRVISGDIEALPVVTAEQREIMLCCARELNEWIPPCRIDPTLRGGKSDPNDNRPGSVFNREGDWQEILEPHGWELVRTGDDGVGYWIRPGKDGLGWSATTDYGGSGLMYPFTTNGDPFEAEVSHTKFGAYTLLNHDGDYRVAARQLALDGYGSLHAEETFSEEEIEEARQAVQAASHEDTARALFEAVEHLAKLDDGELGDVLAERKKKLGPALNLRDIRKVIDRKRIERRTTAGKGGKPRIVVNGRDMEAVTEDALAAIAAANDPPVFFVRGGSLVRLRADDPRPMIDEAAADVVRCQMAQTALYVKCDDNGIREVSPPLDIAKNIVALGRWPLPELEGVVQSPVMRPDGTVLDAAGYDPATRLYHAPVPGLEMGEIPREPDKQAVKYAVETVSDLLCDFSFVDQSDLANTFALMLTPVVRPAIDGCVPLTIVTATQPGSGKGLLVNVANQIARGRDASVVGEPESPAEWRKQITTRLAEGNSFVIIDNVENPVGDAGLAAVLTTRRWSDRLLGTNTMVDLPNNAFWIVTGNNVATEGDIHRRCFWVRLDPKMPCPEQRTGFRHPDLLGYVRRHRGEILAALLTLASAWFAAGQPHHDVPVMGSFQEWTNTIGGIIAHAGVTGFMGNADEQRRMADQEDESIYHFLLSLRGHFSTGHFSASAVSDAVGCSLGEYGDSQLADSLPDHLAVLRSRGSVEFTVRLGNFFRRIQGRRFGDAGVYIERSGMRSNRVLWRVRFGSETGSDTPP